MKQFDINKPESLINGINYSLISSGRRSAVYTRHITQDIDSFEVLLQVSKEMIIVWSFPNKEQAEALFKKLEISLSECDPRWFASSEITINYSRI